MGKTHRSHPYEKKIDHDVIYKVNKDDKQCIVDEIRKNTACKNEIFGIPQFSFPCKNVEMISLGKNKRWERELDLPILETEFYDNSKIKQRVKVPYPVGCGSGEANTFILKSTPFIKQRVTNMNEDEEKILNEYMKKKRLEKKEKLAKKESEYYYHTDYILENNIPFDHYKKVMPINNKYVTQKQLKKNYCEPCECCFHRNGRIWMLRGNGDKALCKNKGMKKIHQKGHDEQMNVV